MHVTACTSFSIATSTEGTPTAAAKPGRSISTALSSSPQSPRLLPSWADPNSS